MIRRVTTPLRWGHVSSRGDFDLTCFLETLFARMDWFMVRSAVGVAWKERNWARAAEGLICEEEWAICGIHIGELRARARSEASIGGSQWGGQPNGKPARASESPCLVARLFAKQLKRVGYFC